MNIDTTFPVLDKGFVRVVDYMGDEAAIVQAARVSYGKGTKSVQEDVALLRYLMRHRHTSPFEMCELKLHIKVPMDTWRQWIRHRTASVNEYSTRYSEAIDDRQETAPADWRSQSKCNKQGSADYLSEDSIGASLSASEQDLHLQSKLVYESRLQAGVAREQARKDLPLSTYTEAYWKIDLHNLLHFLELRMHEHAQKEIRAYANEIGSKIVSVWVPNVWEAFCDYRLNKVELSSREVSMLKCMLTEDPGSVERQAILGQNLGWLTPAGTPTKACRELLEFEDKLTKFGLVPKWRSS